GRVGARREPLRRSTDQQLGDRAKPGRPSGPMGDPLGEPPLYHEPAPEELPDQDDQGTLDRYAPGAEITRRRPVEARTPLVQPVTAAMAVAVGRRIRLQGRDEIGLRGD